MAAHQAPLPMGFSRQEYWSVFPRPLQMPHRNAYPNHPPKHIYTSGETIKNIHTSVDSSSKKLEVTQMSLNKCNEKLIVLFSYDGIPYQSEND